MTDEPPVPPPVVAPADGLIFPPVVPQTDGRVVIDLTQLLPPSPPEPCDDPAPDPLNTEIVVCEATAPSPRLGPMVGPVDDGFGTAFPRARIKLSEHAEAEANVHNAPVGGFNANGGEVRLKIGF